MFQHGLVRCAFQVLDNRQDACQVDQIDALFYIRTFEKADQKAAILQFALCGGSGTVKGNIPVIDEEEKLGAKISLVDVWKHNRELGVLPGDRIRKQREKLPDYLLLQDLMGLHASSLFSACCQMSFIRSWITLCWLRWAGKAGDCAIMRSWNRWLESAPRL